MPGAERPRRQRRDAKVRGYGPAGGGAIREVKADRLAQLAQGCTHATGFADFGMGHLWPRWETSDALGHHPRVAMGAGYVDLKLSSDDAIYRDDEGTEHVVEWVTAQDIDLARRITEICR